MPARLRAMQLDFLRPAGPAPERLAATLARLAAMVGLENVGAPAPFDVILSNPPYLAIGESPNLPPTVRDHDPRTPWRP